MRSDAAMYGAASERFRPRQAHPQHQRQRHARARARARTVSAQAVLGIHLLNAVKLGRRLGAAAFKEQADVVQAQYAAWKRSARALIQIRQP